MGLFDFIKGGTKELAIARPDDKKDLLVYKHTDPTIPNKAQLTVGMDEVALFFKDGQFVGKIESGRHTLDTVNIPFLNRLIDTFTGGNVFKAEVWFVTTREMAGYRFGGRIGDVEDPKTGLAIQLMVHGDYSMQVNDPALLIQFFGQRALASDEEFTGWFRQQLLKTIRERIAARLVEKQIPLLQVTSGVMTSEIEQDVLEAVKSSLNPYGLRIARMGNFVVSMKEEDEQNLKGMYKDVAQMKMVGGLKNYQQFAMGKAMMSGGENGDGGSNPIVAGAGLGVGMMMAQQMASNQGQASEQKAQSPSGPTLQERLAKLKELKDAGLIDDAEYASKRAEILKEV